MQLIWPVGREININNVARLFQPSTPLKQSCPHHHLFPPTQHYPYQPSLKLITLSRYCICTHERMDHSHVNRFDSLVSEIPCIARSDSDVFPMSITAQANTNSFPPPHRTAWVDSAGFAALRVKEPISYHHYPSHPILSHPTQPSTPQITSPSHHSHIITLSPSREIHLPLPQPRALHSLRILLTSTRIRTPLPATTRIPTHTTVLRRRPITCTLARCASQTRTACAADGVFGRGFGAVALELGDMLVAKQGRAGERCGHTADCLPQEQVAFSAQTQEPERLQQVAGLVTILAVWLDLGLVWCGGIGC